MARSLFFSALTLAACLVAAPPAAAQSPAGRPVLLDFSTPGCLPCREMEPIVARLQHEGFDVRKVDGSRDPQTVARFRVRAYPTFVLLAGGREVWRTEGKVDYRVLRASLLNASPRVPATPPARVLPATFDSPTAPAKPSGAAFQVGGDFGPADPPAKRPAPSAGPAPEQLLNATVRLRVEDPQGHAFGTGTIIDAREGEALVLTCGHLFRGSGDEPTPTIELFDTTGGAPRVVDRAPGRVIAVDLENDVALVTLKPNRPVRTAPVAASLGAAVAGGPAWSVGCDLGADPTVRASRVVGVNRTHRPPNVSSTGAPVQGRSGGGLFNAAGELVGVCFGADNERDEGLYADLVSIHAALDKLGLTEIYRQRNAGGQPAVAAATAPSRPRPLVPVPPPIVRAQDNPPPGSALAGLASLSGDERAALQEIGARAAEAEVICIVRPKTADGRSEVISLDRVSPVFLQALRDMPGTPR